MEQQPLKRCPIGIQTFEEIINKDYLYIDKTEYIYRLAHSASKYCFLNRPPKFGKSLLVSTLHSYFSGKKEFFRGLAIEKLETEWTEYPVLHFDMSRTKHPDKEKLNDYLARQLRVYNEKYGLTENNGAQVNNQLADLIKRAYEQTGRQVVVLIDGYDTPLLDVVHEEQKLSALRNVMYNFYSPLKACDPYLRFVFLTGITKFSQLSMSGTLNNMTNISMNIPYAAICGITQEEMLEQMPEYIRRLADKMGISFEEAVEKLEENYGGYHFTWPSPDIFNPFSLLNAFEDDKLNSYQFGSGIPTYLTKVLRKFNTLTSEVGHSMQALAISFDAPTERMTNNMPLLYQSGYITIKDYDKLTQLYTLDIPNREIRIGLMQSLNFDPGKHTLGDWLIEEPTN